ncbi:MAG: Stp1/IreP family PP2C-type Ser/Thr phosphatase [Burkholderiales bacterium]|nr:Stp1/IreP family PP2C-type Ser/Thr phosphatase [Burkholderiales bacterium]MCA3157517.1 Stp1/IreP family PP2C-type Ser/Thr phosphatase [Burkholderiales bacterium]
MTYHPNVRLEFTSATDPGMVRAHNEDSVAVSAQYGLAVLADGMGGYNAGEVAALMATASLRHQIEAALTENPHIFEAEAVELWHQWLQSHIQHVNLDIYEAGLSNEEFSGMGTTLVMALFYGQRLLVAHIGDSRLYRLRHGNFLQITRDHSLLQAEIDVGLITPEEARHALHKNLVTRAVGVTPFVSADMQELDTQAGDTYLLCSDGLTDMVEDEIIAAILENQKYSLEAKASLLINSANDRGGRDNISVILIRIGDHDSNRLHLTGRLTAWLKKSSLA